MLGASIRFSVGSQNWKPLAFRRSKVIRWRQHAARNEGEVQVRVNLRKPLPTLLAEAWEWYPAHMLKRRVDLARSKQLDLSAVVMDGNAKLSGRICGRPAAEIIDNRSLDMFTVTCCSAEPQFKKRRCMKHDTSHAPADPLPEQSEVFTAHRRVRRAGQGELYDVFLKVKDAPNLAGRWVNASLVTATQLHEYWRKLEASGFVPEKSAAEDLAASSCKTHKEIRQGTRAQVQLGSTCVIPLFKSVQVQD